MTVHVFSYDTANPGDTSDLEAKLAALDPARITKLALLVKTEGNSDVNDYSRDFGMLSASLALKAFGGEDLLKRSTLLFSTGCEGAMTPFGYLFVDIADDDAGNDGAGQAAPSTGAALVFGRARSRSLTPDEIGTPANADIVSDTVRAAMDDAGVGPDDVALVIVKTPVTSLLPATAGAVKNKRINSGFAKAVGALGAGVALGEVDRSRVVQDAFNTDHSIHARRAIVFSGAELDCVEILVLANRKGASGSLRVHSGQISDVIDTVGIRRILSEAGCALSDGAVANPESVVATILKVGLDPSGRLRGERTTMRSSHLDMDKHLRATVSGVISSIVGTSRNFISANTVHQAPPGGGLCAFIVRDD